MRARGSLYLLVLVFLIVVSVASELALSRLMEYPRSISGAWARVMADQYALSGLEYASALLADHRPCPEPLVLSFSQGRCRVTVETVGEERHLTAVGEVPFQGGLVVAMRTRSVGI